MQVPFVSLDRQYKALASELRAEFDRIGRSGTYIMGETLERFEAQAAQYCETRYALGVANGADALFLILKALNIGEGDEVITCTNSFIASAGAIAATGAKPVLVDTAEDYNIDTTKLKVAISPRTRAIIPVHLTGRPADMDAINDIAQSHRLAVIEDAAQAIGARYKTRRVGSLGTAAAFSLHPLKNLGVYGDGGLITTNSDDLYEKLSKLRNHGLKNRDECVYFGYNSRLDTLQAAFASVKLKYLDEWNERCRQIAASYRDNLRSYVQVPTDKAHEDCVYHNFVIQTPFRDELIEELQRKGVSTRIHYPIPIHLQEAASYLGYQLGDFPVAERQAKHILSLPIYPELEDKEVEYVIQSVRSFFDSKGN